jgi:Stage II sporulation protein E (SpoIIE)
VGGLRGARQQGASLLEQATTTNAALSENAVEGALDDFVTRLIRRPDLRLGRLELVNAGHVAPYLARDGVVRAVNLPADIPFGLFPETTYHSSPLELEPGDRVVLVTDGMIERNTAGIDLSTALRETRALHPREAGRGLAGTVPRATGHDLRDDATVMLLDWHGQHPRKRSTASGADPGTPQPTAGITQSSANPPIELIAEITALHLDRSRRSTGGRAGRPRSDKRDQDTALSLVRVGEVAYVDGSAPG